MLIRNAMIDGRLTDLRLKHGRVQEMGSGLAKSLYESDLELAGDELRLCAPDTLLSRSVRRRMTAPPQMGGHIMPGTPAPLTRWRDGVMIGVIDEHTAD
ncbi:MAG: hypothetical protein IJZ74_10815 [Clostridia bacterium]|nr:hypothetical protein [Clostridia bacterium]